MITTVSLPTARLLKESGFRQECEFYYTHPYCMTIKECRENGHNAQIGKAIPYVKNKNKWTRFPYNASLTEEKIAAPTTDELIAELPERLIIEKFPYGHKVSVPYLSLPGDAVFFFEGKFLCEALAKMYLHLAKENLL